MPHKLEKSDKSFFVDDGAKRGPMTIFRLQFHPSEPKLLAQCVDRRLAWWNLQGEPTAVKGQKEKRVVGELLCPHEIGWIRGFAFHPRGESVATGGSDRTLRLWPWADGRPAAKPLRQVAAHASWVEAVAFAPRGDLIATAGSDRTIKIWDAADLAPKTTLAGHASYAADIAFTPDGRWLVSGGEDGRVMVWDTDTWQVVRTIESGNANNQYGQIPKHSGVHRLSISRDSRWLSVAGGEKLDLYDLASGAWVASERVSMETVFHPAIDVLAGGESEVKCWAYDAGKFQPAAPDKNGKPQPPKGIAGESFGGIKRGDWSLGLTFSPDGKQLAAGRADGTVELFQLT